MNTFLIGEFGRRTITSDRYFNQLMKISPSPLQSLREVTEHHYKPNSFLGWLIYFPDHPTLHHSYMGICTVFMDINR